MASRSGSSLLLRRGRCFSSSATRCWFDSVPHAPKDPILGVSEAFKADPNPLKINLGVGAYRCDDGQPVVLEAVREAEMRLAGQGIMEYLPIGGNREFCHESVKLAYGEGAAAIKEGRVAMVQALSGTGACRLFADFQARFMPGSKILIPSPTWSNHHNIWRDARVEEELYPYYKPKTKGLDFERMMDKLNTTAPGNVVLLHACAHNPTGVDPSTEQWREISKLMLERRLFPLFDMAYQGFASGDCDRDAQAVHIFLNDGHQLALAQSFAKNMGLYGQRIGCLSIVATDAEHAQAVESQVKAIARPMYSNPPLHGALLVHHVLTSPELKKQWYGEVKDMADRIIQMRHALRKHLEDLGSPHNWQHITDQIGMFAYTGMTPEQVDRLTNEFSIYLTRNGRISIAGINTSNVARLAEAMHKVTSS